MFPEDFAASMVAATIFCLTFLFGRHIYPFRSFVRDRRVLISFSAGISTAYLFIGMMPELAEAATKVEVAGSGLFHAPIVYMMALLGFSVFYALDHGTPLRRSHERGAESEGSEGRVYGYGLYVMLLTYMLAAEEAESFESTIWYAIGMSFHFLAIDHSLRESRGSVYDRLGRFIMALACAIGWITGQILELSELSTSLAWGFVSGAVIVNSAVMELPEGRNGRIMPFLFGGVLYGSILILVMGSF